MTETIEYRDVVDKSSWARGPWDFEPDKVQWQDPATGLPCLIVRGPSGALCGYVGVSAGHPLFGKAYDETELSAHGGLTFSNMCQEGMSEASGICHKPAAGEPDHVYWFGFDCAHAGDLTPGTDAALARFGSRFHIPGNTYKSLEYVQAQCLDLARQLKEKSHD